MTLITRLLPAFDDALTLQERALSRELQLVARARADGARNHPPTEETDTSEIENTLLARGQHAIDDAAQWLKRRFAERAKAVLDLAPTPAERDTDALEAEARFALAKLREENRDRFEALALTEAAARMELRKFQRDNRLTRSAHYARHPILVVGLVAVMLAVESILNMGAFAEASNYGLVGGWLKAIGYSAVNAILGYIVTGSLGLRSALHVAPIRRAMGIGLTAIGVTMIVGFNAYIATERAILATQPDSLDLIGTFTRLSTDPTGFLNVTDATRLFVAGLAFAMIFTIKGFAAFDRYPGYRHVHLCHVRAVEDLDKAKLKFRNDAENAVHAHIETLKGNLAAAEARNRTALDHINHAEIDATVAEGSAQASAAVCQKLIRTWRDENAAIRTTPAPEYFRHLPQIDRELRGVPKVDFNLHREARRNDLEDLRSRVDATQARLREMSLEALRIVREEAENAGKSGSARATEDVQASGAAVITLRTAAE